MSKLTINIPDGDLCEDWSNNSDCVLFDTEWMKCRYFNKTLRIKYSDQDEFDILGTLKCKECINKLG